MIYFLERIASHLLAEYGDRIESQCLVFPNRRAGLYFMKYLSGKAGKVMWAPAVKTINELFTISSSLKVAETETLIFELYRVYKDINPDAESFDDFYFWGEMIINDFDDVDKYLIDASALFSNLADLKRIDTTFGELTEDQVKIVRQFWVNFNAGSETRAKAGFLGLWSMLSDIYKSFRETLSARGIAYEGMIFRELAEKCRKGILPDLKWETFHFIGFNAINNCERSLLKALKKNSKARFYWDYDTVYTGKNTDHSAGYFIRDNIREFGNDMPSDWSYSTFLSNPATEIKRKVIDTSSDTAQVKIIPDLLSGLDGLKGEEASKTAIILADESLLIPLLSTIPETVDDVNITMGYPLKFSPVYSLVNSLLSLQCNCRREGKEVLFDHSDVFNILRNSFLSTKEDFRNRIVVSELIRENRQWIPSGRLKKNPAFEEIFRKIDDPLSLSSYIKSILELIYVPDDEEDTNSQSVAADKINNEFIYSTLLVINRIESAIAGCDIKLTANTWARLLDRILRGITIPFLGEPLKGIQVMGILETRCLDFRNLIFLSVSEGILPRSSAGSSYIPHNLREAFGLPTIRHQDSIYAYYFYRLLHKAENVTFVYNSNSEGLRTGEMSRFLMQLDYLYTKPPDHSGVSFEISLQNPAVTRISRNEKHSLKLKELFTGQSAASLSPSAVNSWLNCRMRFFYKYICGLKEPERIITDIDPLLFGELLHSIMERIYTPFLGKVMSAGTFKLLLANDNEIFNITREIINERFNSSRSRDISGNEQITGSILAAYARLIVRRDSEGVKFTISQLEKKAGSEIKIRVNNGISEINTGGIIDRVDLVGSSYRIVDYKTGSISMEIKSVESLFDENDDKRNEAWFQILMYCEILAASDEKSGIIPSIYAVRNLNDKDYSGLLTIKNHNGEPLVLDRYDLIRGEFRSGLEETLMQIFSRDSAFIMTGHVRKCEYCPYRQLCRR